MFTVSFKNHSNRKENIVLARNEQVLIFMPPNQDSISQMSCMGI